MSIYILLHIIIHIQLWGDTMISSRNAYIVKNLLCKNLDSNLNEKGKLGVTVFHEQFRTPLANALVKIYKVTVSGEYDEKGDGLLINQFITDVNGKIPDVDLPILNELMTDSKDFYSIAVHAINHYSAYVFNAEIYPDITTMYNISLQFIYTSDDKFQFIMQPTRSEIIEKRREQ